MIATYISQRSWEWTKNEASIVFFGLLYPVMPGMRLLTYLSGISFALMCTVVVDTVRIISWWYREGSTTDIISTRERRVELNLFQKRTVLHPVTEKRVALGGVNLALEFIVFFGQNRYTIHRVSRFPS